MAAGRGPKRRRSKNARGAGARRSAAKKASADTTRGRPKRGSSTPRREQDAFGHRAKAEGYPARSIYKLEEMDRRVGLLKRGQRVLDLGAAPGSWSLYAAEKVGPRGKVIGLDLQPHAIERALPACLELRVGDARTLDTASLGGACDVLLSDMAPKTTGVRAADMYRSYELFRVAVDAASELVKPGGAFVGKIFQGEDFDEGRAALKRVFKRVRTMRPEAIRPESYEVYLVGQEKRPERLPEPS